MIPHTHITTQTFTVVHVHRGIIAEVSTFSDPNEADTHMDTIKDEDYNEQDDDIGIFPATLDFGFCIKDEANNE